MTNMRDTQTLPIEGIALKVTQPSLNRKCTTVHSTKIVR
jgi:hypothetical protein